MKRRIINYINSKKEVEKKVEKFLDVDVNINVDNVNEDNETYNENYKSIKNNTELYNEIEKAYDTSLETINKVAQTIDIQNKAESDTSADSGNTTDITIGDGNDGIDLDINQQAELNATISLAFVASAVAELQVSNTQKAIVSDMLGLTEDNISNTDQTQDGDNTGDATADVDVDTDIEHYSANTSSYSIHTLHKLIPTSIRKHIYKGTNIPNSNSKRCKTITPKQLLRKMVYMTHNNKLKEHFFDITPTVTDTNTNVTNKVSNIIEDLQENDTKETNIQKYISTLTDKVTNINEYSTNLENSLNQAVTLAQSNTFNLKIGDNNKDINIKINQINKMKTEVKASYESFMQTVSQTINNTDNEYSDDTQGSQTNTDNTDTSQTGGNSGSSSGSSTSIFKVIRSNIVNIIIVLVILSLVIGLIKWFISNKSATNNTTHNYEMPDYDNI